MVNNLEQNMSNNVLIIIIKIIYDKKQNHFYCVTKVNTDVVSLSKEQVRLINKCIENISKDTKALNWCEK